MKRAKRQVRKFFPLLYRGRVYMLQPFHPMPEGFYRNRPHRFPVQNDDGVQLSVELLDRARRRLKGEFV